MPDSVCFTGLLSGFAMSRSMIFLAVIVIAVVAGVVTLGTRKGERPVVHVEKVVQLGDLKK